MTYQDEVLSFFVSQDDEDLPEDDIEEGLDEEDDLEEEGAEEEL